MKRIGLLLLFLAAIAHGQAAPKKAVAPPSRAAAFVAAKPVPNSKDYKNYDDFAAALVAWALDREAAGVGNQPVQDARPARFQIFINPNVRADTFLLDTETGRVWSPVVYTDLENGPQVWQIHDRVDSQSELYDWIERHRAKPKAVQPTASPQEP
ncbi:MAG: hypothetical protein ABSE53_00370 [Terracidiphilus sp.]|jgi:hypothetical protein